MSVRTVAHWLAGAGLNRRRDTRPHRADQPGQQNDPGPFPGPNDPPGRQEGRTHPTRGTAGGPTDAPIPRRRPPPSGARAPGPATPTCTAPSRPSPTWPVPRPSMTRRPPPQSAFSAAPGLYHDRHLPGSRRQRTRPYIHVTTARSSATTASWLQPHPGRRVLLRAHLCLIAAAPRRRRLWNHHNYHHPRTACHNRPVTLLVVPGGPGLGQLLWA